MGVVHFYRTIFAMSSCIIEIDGKKIRRFVSKVSQATQLYKLLSNCFSFLIIYGLIYNILTHVAYEEGRMPYLLTLICVYLEGVVYDNPSSQEV